MSNIVTLRHDPPVRKCIMRACPEHSNVFLLIAQFDQPIVDDLTSPDSGRAIACSGEIPLASVPGSEPNRVVNPKGSVNGERESFGTEWRERRPLASASDAGRELSVWSQERESP